MALIPPQHPTLLPAYEKLSKFLTWYSNWGGYGEDRFDYFTVSRTVCILWILEDIYKDYQKIPTSVQSIPLNQGQIRLDLTNAQGRCLSITIPPKHQPIQFEYSSKAILNDGNNSLKAIEFVLQYLTTELLEFVKD